MLPQIYQFYYWCHAAPIAKNGLHLTAISWEQLYWIQSSELIHHSAWEFPFEMVLELATCNLLISKQSVVNLRFQTTETTFKIWKIVWNFKLLLQKLTVALRTSELQRPAHLITRKARPNSSFGVRAKWYKKYMRGHDKNRNVNFQ